MFQLFHEIIDDRDDVSVYEFVTACSFGIAPLGSEKGIELLFGIQAFFPERILKTYQSSTTLFANTSFSTAHV